MSTPTRRVSRGERLRIPADAWNAAMDAAEAHRTKRFNFDGEAAAPFPVGLVLVRNDSGAAVPRFGVLALNGPVITPSANLIEFRDRPCFKGIVPTASTRNFVVVQEPLPAGAIGRAVVSGMSVARLNVAVNEEDFDFATALASTGTAALASAEAGQAEVLWREGGTGEQEALVRLSNTPTTAAGETFLGVVTAPSVDGSTTSSYTVEIYGTTIASLADAPTVASATAVQSPATNKYYRGELVGLRKIGADWFIEKFLTLPIAYTVAAQQVCLRLWNVGQTAGTSSLTNMLVDLHSCLTYFDDGVNTQNGYAAFDYGVYAGIGLLGTAISVPVRYESGWNLATPRLIVTDSNFVTALAAVVSGTVTQVATSQDTFSSFTHGPPTIPNGITFQSYATQSVALAAGAYVAVVNGSSLDILGLSASVLVGFTGLATSVSSYFPALLTLPTITHAVQSILVPLTRCQVQIAITSTQAATASVNKVDPTITVHKAQESGGASIAGTYALVPTAPAVSPFATVSAT